MNINYENVKAAYYRGQNILKIYSGSTLEWEYETEPVEQTTKQIWYNSVSGDVVEPYAASAIGTVVSNTAYESKCVLEFASDVTAIGANAFSGCTDLEYVSLPVSATSIGDNAFDGCSSLDGIYMPSVQSIGRESFKDCAFSAFTVPTSVTAITADAFKGVAIEEFNYNGTKAQWSGITYGDFWDEDTWITNVIHCSDGDIELYQYDYSKRYLEFVATSGGTFQFSGSSTANTISYSTDQGKTWSTPATSVTINVSDGDNVLWKGSTMTPQIGKGIGTFSASTASFDIQGNGMSMLYGDNFVGQTSLSGKNYAFYSLFNGSKIVDASNLILPATTLGERSYMFMFQGCTSLTTAPELPATTLNGGCYWGMFNGCTSLTTAPELSATTLNSGCYRDMFAGCTSLVTAPELPATTLADGCYWTMFQGCTSLTQAPELPATTLANQCYFGMFQSCTSLVTAPELPATTLANQCYQGMFYLCTNLNYIKMLATDISASDCLNGWVRNVANSGTFVKSVDMTTLPTGNSGIPNGWTVQDFPPNYLRFVAKSGGTFNFSGSSTANTISYSTDSGDTWSTPAQVVSVNVNSGDTVMWKGNMTPTNNGIGTYSASTASFDAKGNIMSLLYGDSFKNQTSLSGKNNAFRELFYATKVINAANVELPATSLSDNCYYIMFAGCTSLTQAPSLPSSTLAQSCYAYMFSGCTALANAPVLSATTLTNGCYSNMFKNCTSLTTAPQLPATTLTQGCYTSMFYGCTSLTTAPALSATTLANNCYETMFRDCTSLTTAPDLLSTTLVQRCYYQMFYGCSNLNYIKMLATDISATYCLSNWVSGVANSGTFVKAASMTTLPTGSDGIPSGWTVEDFTPPHDYSQDYFTIVAKEDGEIQIQPECAEVWHPGESYEDPETGEWIEDEGYTEYYACPVQYSVNDGEWETITADTYSPDTFVIEVENGDEVRFKCNLADAVFEDPYDNTIYHTYQKPCSFTSSQGASFDVQGNIMSLVYGDDFENNTGLTYEYSYFEYEEGNPVEATGTCDVSFLDLFNESYVVDASNLILPSTTLTDACYQDMFMMSTLTTAPQLPAATLTTSCYSMMFAYCSNLNYIKMLATNISANGCLGGWVGDVAETGTFVKATSMTSLPTGANGIPSGWTVENEGEEEQSFPVSGFNFNYNFKNYDSATHTVPNESGASWNQDLVLQGTPVVDTDHITVTDSDAYAQFPFASNDANIFNLNNTDKREMTVIFKVGNISGADSTPNNLINNRGRYSTGGNDNMNWMVRPKQTICALHDSNSEKASVSYSTKPNIFVMTVSNGTVNNKSITDNVTSTGSVNFTAMAGRICFFCANLQSTATDYITSTERFSGVCYWMFQANRVLTDAEITQVINYNENL